MRSLFGIPVGSLLVVLLGALVVAAGALGVLALRNPVLVRIALRNVVRRRGRSALIVVGLMLGTAIIAAALTTGDTMSHTIRAGAVKALGQTDELVSARGAQSSAASNLGAATGVRYLDARVARLVEARLRGTGLADGVTPAIAEDVAVQDPARRQNEPRVTLFAADPARMRGFGTIQGSGGAVTLAQLRPGEIYLNAHAADELNARRGDRVLLFAGSRVGGGRYAVVRDVVRYDGGGTTASGALMGLAAAQTLLGVPERAKYVLVSNAGGAESGAARSDAVVRRLAPVLAPLRLEAKASKADALRDADKAGSAFMGFFTTFGSFSIAAGILLIFLIFVMLAAERRSELGIARAVGTRRGHLVLLFTFEGAAYDLVAALAGALLGALVAYGMVALMAKALGSQGFDVHYAVTLRSLLVAYALGALLTLVVVALSAWRVSRMTVATAIRNLPEPGIPRRRRRLALTLGGLVLGGLMTVSGAAAAQATPLMLGLSLVLIALVPLVELAGVPERAAFTGAGLAVVVLWMLPWSVWEAVFGKLAMNFGVWIAGGLIVVVGAVWIIMYNAHLLSAAAVGVLGRWRSLAPMLRTSMAYPLSAKLRSGITLAMFTLVVFTLVTGTTSSGSFTHAFQDVKAYGGGFDVRATSSPAAPIDDMHTALNATPSVRPRDFTVVASQSALPVDARQVGTGRRYEAYPLRGLDASYLAHTTYGMAATARGYGSARAVWRAIATHRNLAVVDNLVVPRRQNFSFNAVPSKFKLTGFYVDDGTFAPIPLLVRDPQTGRRVRLTVIGVLAETVPIDMAGIWTSQASAATAFPGRVRPTMHWFAVRHGVSPAAAAKRIESAFLRSGMQADAVRKLLNDVVRSSLTFNRLIQGFMALGLIVGVAALGVISARAVVERRQQIGVMRAIGFRRRMVQVSFLLESSFVALTAIVVGTGLGLLLANNIVVDERKQPSWHHLTLVVPWVNLGIIFAAVYAVALLATWAPARRASRIRPAEALRYE
jgi:putative ABC transport system permease protein